MFAERREREDIRILKRHVDELNELFVSGQEVGTSLSQIKSNLQRLDTNDIKAVGKSMPKHALSCQITSVRHRCPGVAESSAPGCGGPARLCSRQRGGHPSRPHFPGRERGAKQAKLYKVSEKGQKSKKEKKTSRKKEGESHYSH